MATARDGFLKFRHKEMCPCSANSPHVGHGSDDPFPPARGKVGMGGERPRLCRAKGTREPYIGISGGVLQLFKVLLG